MHRSKFVLIFAVVLFHSAALFCQSADGSVSYDTIFNPLCEGESVYLNDSLINTAGVYYGYEVFGDGSRRYLCVIIDVYPSYNDTIRASICAGDTFSMYGFSATKTGSYTHYRRTKLGCDSITTLVLSVGESTYDTIRATTCSGLPYTSYGFNESQPGTYTHYGISRNGCDSNVTLILSIDRDYNDTIWAMVHSGEIYSQFGFEEYEAGTYVMSGKTQLGCDSTTTLVLTQSIIDTTLDIILCPGDTFWLDGIPYTIPDTYYGISSFGMEVCPYHVIINLSYTSGATLQVSDATLCADEGVLEIRYVFASDVPAQSASVSFVSGLFQGMSEIPLSSDSAVISIPVLEPSSHSAGYTRPDTYNAVLTIDNGVCSPVSAEFRFDVLYPSWLIHQKWKDVLMVINEHYNGGYTFTAFQWFKDGVKIEGERNAYLYVPEFLDMNSEYSVELTRADDGKTIKTCSMMPEMRDSGYVEYVNPYITVFPTIVERSSATVTVNTNSKGEYWIYTPTGKLIEYDTYDAGEGETFQLSLPFIPNVYFIKFKTDDDTSKTERIIVH